MQIQKEVMEYLPPSPHKLRLALSLGWLGDVRVEGNVVYIGRMSCFCLVINDATITGLQYYQENTYNWMKAAIWEDQWGKYIIIESSCDPWNEHQILFKNAWRDFCPRMSDIFQEARQIYLGNGEIPPVDLDRFLHFLALIVKAHLK